MKERATTDDVGHLKAFVESLKACRRFAVSRVSRSVQANGREVWYPSEWEQATTRDERQARLDEIRRTL